MLFSSYQFLFLYLPVALAGFALVSHCGNWAAKLWLTAASLVFYGAWNPQDLPVLTGSLVANFAVGQGLGRPLSPRLRWWLLCAGVVGNLSLLAYFKYTWFAVGSLDAIFGGFGEFPKLALPLAISHFTFQQIAYLVDAYRGHAGRYPLLDYTLFVTFFPQLIAGPIVHHEEIVTQVNGQRRWRLRIEDLSIGLAIFVVGLFKKVLIAESVAPWAKTVFAAADYDQPMGSVDAWVGVLAYSLQLYFDFSGYSDMAIGLGRMFSIQLPRNFDSPYKATSISDFWRRWHITLSRFLRDYLYIPLGGNRCGTVRRYLNLLLTMTIGGLWHGAGWTYILWGAMHGLLLCGNHGWTAICERYGWTKTPLWRECLHRVLTLLAVMAAWTLFRAETVGDAWSIWIGLAGLSATSTSLIGDPAQALMILLVILAVAMTAPNTQELFAAFQPTSGKSPNVVISPLYRWLTWHPDVWHGAALGAVFVVAITYLTRVQEFIYFRF